MDPANLLAQLLARQIHGLQVPLPAPVKPAPSMEKHEDAADNEDTPEEGSLEGSEEEGEEEEPAPRRRRLSYDVEAAEASTAPDSGVPVSNKHGKRCLIPLAELERGVLTQLLVGCRIPWCP